MPTKKHLLIAALAALVSAAVWLVAHWPQRAAQPPALASSSPNENRTVVATVAASPVAPVAAATSPGPAPDTPEPGEAESAATARMFAAHAPLRVPEVADPDSAANRRILQTMVTKALLQSAPPAAALAPTK